MAFARARGNWFLVSSPETHFLPVRSLDGWRGDGVIAMINTPAEARFASELSMPVVNISGALCETPVPRVRVDYEAIGRAAADHLLARGFRRFAYYGLRRVWYAKLHGEGFRRRVAEFGHACHIHEASPSFSGRQPWHEDGEALHEWLRSLETPVGLLASHDDRAILALDACRKVGLRVPEDVAIVGVNDDALSCEYCEPSLTSVARNGYAVGYQVAALLHRLMRGKTPPKRDVVIEPGQVVERGSTRVLAIDDAKLQLAVTYVLEHLDEPFGVNDVVEAVAMSRRWLENAFRDHLRRTPAQFISEARVERAKTLLCEQPKRTLKQVALACGFASATRLNVVFARLTGLTPREWRDDNHSPS